MDEVMDKAVEDTAYNIVDKLVNNVVCNLFQVMHGLVHNLVHDVRRDFVNIVRRDLEAGWDRTWLSEIKDVEKSLQVIEGDGSTINGSLANIQMHLSGHHTVPSSVMEEVKSGYYAALYLVASLNTKIEARQTNLELQKINLERMRMEEEIELISGKYFDCTDADGKT